MPMPPSSVPGFAVPGNGSSLLLGPADVPGRGTAGQ